MNSRNCIDYNGVSAFISDREWYLSENLQGKNLKASFYDPTLDYKTIVQTVRKKNISNSYRNVRVHNLIMDYEKSPIYHNDLYQQEQINMNKVCQCGLTF